MSWIASRSSAATSLVVIDNTDTRLALRQAEADLARARAQVTAATADLERSGIDLKRREALVASGSVSGDELTKVINGASDARAYSTLPAQRWRWPRPASIRRKSISVVR